MADHDDVRRIAAKLPGAIESDQSFVFSVMVKGKPKGFAWLWLERLAPKKPRVANPEVLAIQTRNLDVKEILLSQNVPWLFTEPHYNGFPAILVRLPDVPLEELEDLLIEGWRAKAPPDAVRAFTGL